MNFFGFLKVEDKSNWKIILFYILVAYIFNIWVRFIYVDIISQIPVWQFNGTYIINNPDGFYYAEGARDFINGFHQKNDLSPIYNVTSDFTALVSEFFHIPLDKVIFYLPGIIGSLLAVPLILIGEAIGGAFLGFLAALMAPMVWSYYHRTMFGYYDTDMLTVVLPTFAIWGVLWSLKNKNIKYFFLTPLIEIFMIYWHDGLYNVANGIFIMSFVYLLYLKFVKKENIFIESLFLLFLIVPLLPIDIKIKIAVLILLQISVFYLKNKINLKFEKIFYLIVLAIYVFVIGIPWINGVLHSSYFTRAVVNSDEGFKYYDVVNTVREASHISFNTLVHRISGSYAGFFAGALGYLLLIIRYPQMIISLPMVVLGLFAERGGLRFTIFAVPFFALGDAYIVYLIGKLVSKALINEKISFYSKYIVSFLLMLGFIYPNYKHIHEYITPAAMNKNEIETLVKLKHLSKRNDYVLSWWDYGYLIRYYSDVKTLVDGGKHSGDVDFPVSFALTRSELPSYNSAILDVYFTEKHFIDKKKFDFIKDIENYYKVKINTTKDLENFLSQKIPLPKIKENIYYFLPLKMLDIFPTVSVFGSIDIKTGKVQNHFFYKGRLKKQGRYLLLGQIPIDLSKAEIILNQRTIPVKEIDLVAYTKGGKLSVRKERLRKSGLNLIIMQSYGEGLILDDFFYNSTYIQMFIFENYDKNLFKPIIITPYVKIYKVVKH
ncbi:STT3 domain-containing protein [Lebetimonas sp. JH369]|uniref:STT3 domain-containing protein n=1 Tax=Lebetimonas sp. JH369 TaxID=990069 RepID=UPI000463A5B3|nr:STT3 domain-containing protein [Lebetimonas sp. JH369]